MAFLAAIAILMPLSESNAQSGEDGTITVVQPKPLLRRNRLELVPRASWTFSDPYTQSLGVGGSLYYNVAERFSLGPTFEDRKSTRLNSSHVAISYAVFCLKK